MGKVYTNYGFSTPLRFCVKSPRGTGGRTDGRTGDGRALRIMRLIGTATQHLQNAQCEHVNLPKMKNYKHHTYRMAHKKTGPLCLTDCNFGNMDQIGTKLGTNRRHFILNINS